MRPAPSKQPPGTNPSGPNQPGAARPLLGRIAAVLRVISTFVTYGQYLTVTAPARIAAPQFGTVAGVFGTYNLEIILFRIKRGIRRALALQRYLLARSARGRDLRFSWRPTVEQHHLPPPAPRAKPASPRRKPRKEPSVLPDDDLRAFYLPSDAELDQEVRRRPVGRTMTYICLDLGIVPGFCASEFVNQWINVLRRYGGSLDRLARVRERRRESFERERDRRPETWYWNWRDLREPFVREALGLLIGEPPDSASPIPVPS
jgi:hypothetical protein